ncbi:MAG: peptidylprolyl isomerase [Betaproteobacteria bacterium]|nr:peptidylprolyl isomerase [Betaproteobacteria bacterium]
MAATSAAYGSDALWTVSGLNLDRGIGLTITTGTCDGLTEVPGGSAFQRRFSCRPRSLGDLVAQVNDAGGSRIASLRVVIPKPVVQLDLEQGTIDLELDPVAAPVTVQNFLDYANGGFYDNTLFHRVIAGFVIQGGGYAPGSPDPEFQVPTRPPIVLESNNGLSNLRGTLAMARANEPNSATSQFYINVVDNPGLDYRSEEQPGYAVFGRVTAGLELVDAISVVPTRSVPPALLNLPVTDVVVLGARQVR